MNNVNNNEQKNRRGGAAAPFAPTPPTSAPDFAYTSIAWEVFFQKLIFYT